MAAARCSVSFEDTDGVTHTARVQAESLFEAVALAVAEFRQDTLVPQPSPGTDFTIAIERPPVEHRIRFNKVIQWAQSNTTREGPAGVTKRHKMRGLLGICEQNTPRA